MNKDDTLIYQRSFIKGAQDSRDLIESLSQRVEPFRTQNLIERELYDLIRTKIQAVRRDLEYFDYLDELLTDEQKILFARIAQEAEVYLKDLTVFLSQVNVIHDDNDPL